MIPLATMAAIITPITKKAIGKNSVKNGEEYAEVLAIKFSALGSVTSEYIKRGNNRGDTTPHDLALVGLTRDSMALVPLDVPPTIY